MNAGNERPGLGWKTGWRQKNSRVFLVGIQLCVVGGARMKGRRCWLENISKHHPRLPCPIATGAVPEFVSRTGSSHPLIPPGPLLVLPSLHLVSFTFMPPFNKLLAQLWNQSPEKVSGRRQQLCGRQPPSPGDKQHLSKDHDIKEGQPKGNQGGTEESVTRVGSMGKVFGECGWFTLLVSVGERIGSLRRIRTQVVC